MRKARVRGAFGPPHTFCVRVRRGLRNPIDRRRGGVSPEWSTFRSNLGMPLRLQCAVFASLPLERNTYASSTTTDIKPAFERLKNERLEQLVEAWRDDPDHRTPEPLEQRWVDHGGQFLELLERSGLVVRGKERVRLAEAAQVSLIESAAYARCSRSDRH